MLRILVSLGLCAALVAQDPPPPPGGFAVVERLDQLVTWSDGFRTRMDLYRPGIAAPVTGWPGVLAVHGGAENRKTALIRGLSRYLASRGYVVYAYDVSGDGDTIALNPGWPTPRGEDRVLLDSAESHGLARAILPATIDAGRLAVTGNSQGGKHSLEAAAWSGRALPLAGFVATYPLVRAIAPEIAPLDPMSTSLPGGVLIADELVNGRPATDPIVQLLQVEDYAGIVAWGSGQQTAQTLGLLRTSTVPTFAMLAWQDMKHQPLRSIDAFASLSMTRRLFLTTGGHSTPFNDVERALQQELRGRWFDRFLKGIDNGVVREANVEVAVEPDGPAYLDLGSAWEHRQFAQWPPALPNQTFYLRSAGRLLATVPPAVEAGPSFAHRIAAGYTPTRYVTQGSGRAPGQVYASIPRIDRVFETAPVPADSELVGRASLELHLDDSTGTVQLSAELSRIDPSGAPTFLTMGTGALRGVGAGRRVLRFDLNDVAHAVPAGHRLRLTLMNLATHRPPSEHRVRFVPFFTPTDTTVVIEPAAASRISLPLRPYVTNLRPRLAAASASLGIDHRMQVNGGAARAGWLAVTVFGLSGEAPGIPLPGLSTPVPVVFDAWTNLAFSLLGTAVLPNCATFLDANGRATPGMRLPAMNVGPLLGERVTFAGVVIDPAGAFESSFGPVTLTVGL